jgi:two-component system, OmpR family, phosphate regulon sensor histidine kinase PhoR
MSLPFGARFLLLLTLAIVAAPLALVAFAARTGSRPAALAWPALLAAGLVLLVGVPLGLVMLARHRARIVALERGARHLATGDAEARVLELPADELGRLGRAINAVAAEQRGRLEALARERDERERILAHMSDGMASLDGNDRVTHMNARFAELVGRPLPPPAGTPLAEFARVPELEDVVRRARERGASLEVELRLWSPRARLVRATVTPLGAPPAGAAGDGSDANGVLVVLHDLSEVDALNRVRQDFVANAAHELRTPLTSLRGYAETLLDGGLDDAAHRGEFVRVIRDQAVRLEALVADLLSLSELERPGATLKLETLDLRETATRIATMLRPRAAATGLTLEVDPSPPVPVRADRARIEQVLANLLDNAVKYTEKGGVRVRCGRDDVLAWCEVEDTGVGIPAADLPRVFERFYRVDRARSRAAGGTGLGLSIVKHIVALHDGEVSAAARPGGGTVFRFAIPRRDVG